LNSKHKILWCSENRNNQFPKDRLITKLQGSWFLRQRHIIVHFIATGFQQEVKLIKVKVLDDECLLINKFPGIYSFPKVNPFAALMLIFFLLKYQQNYFLTIMTDLL